MSLVATTSQMQLRAQQPLRSTLRPLRAAPFVAPAMRPLGRPVATTASAARPEPEPATAAQPLVTAALGCLTALLLTAAPPSVEAKEVIAGFPRVVDGDTLDFSGTRVRLFGIDAPETKQSCTAKGGEYMCGERSKEALAKKIGTSKVECEQKNRDKYGRVVGVCSANGEDLNGWLVEQGLAVAYQQYSKAYVPLEEAARAAGRGIWSGTFEVPAQWRKENPRGGGGAAAVPVANTGAATAAAVPAVAPPGCPIKGNITAKGEKIYHVPGGAFYERTVIELDKGERFFCSAAEAEAAGWRASAK